MTDPATDRITELLAAHQIESLNQSHVDCWCGWTTEPTPKLGEAALYGLHRAHVASLLAVLVADAQTEAFYKGWAAHNKAGCPPLAYGHLAADANPYRDTE